MDKYAEAEKVWKAKIKELWIKLIIVNNYVIINIPKKK